MYCSGCIETRHCSSFLSQNKCIGSSLSLKFHAPETSLVRYTLHHFRASIACCNFFLPHRSFSRHCSVEAGSNCRESRGVRSARGHQKSSISTTTVTCPTRAVTTKTALGARTVPSFPCRQSRARRPSSKSPRMEAAAVASRSRCDNGITLRATPPRCGSLVCLCVRVRVGEIGSSTGLRTLPRSHGIVCARHVETKRMLCSSDNVFPERTTAFVQRLVASWNKGTAAPLKKSIPKRKKKQLTRDARHLLHLNEFLSPLRSSSGRYEVS